MSDIYTRIPDVTRRRPTWRWLKWLARSVLILALGVAIHGAVAYYRTSGALRQMAADLDRKDPGWRLEEIEAARPAVPDAENGGLIVRDTLPLMPMLWPPHFDFLKIPPPEQYSAANFARLEAELNPLEPALAIARGLARRPRGRLPLEYARDPLETLLPAQVAAQRLNQWLVLDALRQAQAGRMKEALQSCRAALNAARTLGDEPLMISQRIRISGVLDACWTVERTLAQGEPDPKDLEGLQQLLELEDTHDPLTVALRGERAALHRVFELVESGEVALARLDDKFAPKTFDLKVDLQDKYLPWLTTSEIRSEHLLFLSLMTGYIEAASLPLHEQAAAERVLDAKVTPLWGRTRVIRFLMPPVNRFSDHSRRYHAQVRCVLGAVAAERYRRARGRWPATLADLTPAFPGAVPLDPYDGKPLRYRKLPDGVVVYSVGLDGNDDGGRIDRANPVATGTDLGCRLWDVKHRRQPPRPAPAAPAGPPK